MSHSNAGDSHESKAEQDLFEAGLELFSRKGFAATSVREIVEKAGVTKPALYYHFGSKRGLLSTIVGWAMREYERRIGLTLAEAADARDAMIRLMRASFELAAERPRLAALMYLVVFGSEGDSAGVDVSSIPRWERAQVMTVIDRAVHENLVRAEDAQRAALLFSGVINVHLMAYVKGQLPELNSKVAAEAVDLYLCGISAGDCSGNDSGTERG